MRVRHAIITAIRAFFDERGFICVDSPIFTPNACEGTSTLFEVPYFDSKAYLTQSGQLYAEAAAMALGKVYCFGPTFRAEKSKTRRHLTEFWMLEPEVAYATLEDVMQLAEDMLCHVVAYVLRTRKPELAALERDLSKLEAIVPPFPRLTYDEAAAVLAKHPESSFKHGDDFGAPDETTFQRLRPPGDGPPLSQRSSLLHGRGRSDQVLAATCSAAKARRDHRRSQRERATRAALHDRRKNCPRVLPN